jgi:hypothetical protein
VETNLGRLDAVWKQLKELTPDGVPFEAADTVQYENLRRAFSDLADALPTIGGSGFEARPRAFDNIASEPNRTQYVGNAEAFVDVLRVINEPGEELADYRFRMAKVRKAMIRGRAETLVADIDALLVVLTAKVARDGTKLAGDEQWQEIVAGIAELQRLLAGELGTRATSS